MKTIVEALTALLARDWWYRTWVLQEFSTAGQVYFQCGKKRSRLDAFETTITLTTKLFYSTAYSFASTMMMTEFIQGQTIGTMAKSPTVNMAQSFFRERHHFQGAISGNQRELVDLLLTFNSIGASDLRLRATDPKDKVYGMLGLARDAETLVIIPDYQMSVESVYIDVAAKSLRTGDSSFSSFAATIHTRNFHLGYPNCEIISSRVRMTQAILTGASRLLLLANHPNIQSLGDLDQMC